MRYLSTALLFLLLLLPNPASAQIAGPYISGNDREIKVKCVPTTEFKVIVEKRKIKPMIVEETLAATKVIGYTPEGEFIVFDLLPPANEESVSTVCVLNIFTDPAVADFLNIPKEPETQSE